MMGEERRDVVLSIYLHMYVCVYVWFVEAVDWDAAPAGRRLLFIAVKNPKKGKKKKKKGERV